ncbi:DoxX family protein [Chitinophaga niabensis]|uniref:DoxX family protein n=1 Tax=Chitinophaga niabensis TaxID=536979 RepID=A0A1N6DFF7_9BACT|nr:hypothetical protein [Chitinophaga niabensis]SIN69532.1 hypothetical protein SAMN04488055_0695 [Chitinophaga niabensis]
MPVYPTHPWSPTQKISFRFFFAFFILYTFPFPLTIVPYLSYWYSLLWQQIVPWVGAHFLHLPPITIFTNGSGDTTYDYLLLLSYITLALLIAIIWSLLDRRRKSYHIAYHWLRVLVRYYVAGMMFLYGIIKIFHLQMPAPYLSQLVQPFGDKSPMGLAWSYVGYSTTFSAFTGWSEVIAGAFLLFRRTTLLGAVLCSFVAVNIVAINFCFDVPVKLFSSMLLLMSIFLMAPDVQRLLNVFLLNKPAEPRAYYSYLPKRWMRITAIVIKVLYIAYIIIPQVENGINGQKRYGDKRPLPPLYGIYNTELLVRNNDTIPPLTTDTTRWRQLIIQFEKRATVKLMNDTIKPYNLVVDTTLKTATVFSNTDTLHKVVLNYKADSVYLTLSNDSLYYRFKKYDHRNFRLISRGFRWVNEYPYNR